MGVGKQFNSMQEPPACSQCGQPIRLDDALSFDDRWVCANCKPVYVQMLREGASLEPKATLPYAGFWIRGGALFVDAVLQYSVGIGIGMLCGQSLAETTGFDGSEELSTLDWVLLGVGLLVDLSYSTLMVGRYGATVGKLLFRLRVVRPDGTRVSYGRALGRCLANYLNLLTCTIGYVIAAFDLEKRAIHDRVCDTRVIRPSK
jgi:uncharacterized RDD family membrane protein YckC